MTDVAEAPADAANDSGVQSFLVTFNIRRFDPEVDEEPRWVDYDVELYATDRVLDALHKIKWEVDGSLSFRRSCAHGICGSDAMRINGRNRLACKTLIKDLDLLETKRAVFTPNLPDGTQGQPQVIAEYFGVAEEKLRAIPADKLVELRDSGALEKIYNHLSSLVGWDRLIAIASAKQARTGPIAANIQ